MTREPNHPNTITFKSLFSATQSQKNIVVVNEEV